jgi:hypothetical protein
MWIWLTMARSSGPTIRYISHAIGSSDSSDTTVVWLT